MSPPAIVLKPDRAKSLQRRHPWLFSNAVQNVIDAPEAGAAVDIVTHDKRWLARAAYSPQSQIRARIWTFQQSQTIDRDFFQQRLKQAIDVRKALFKNKHLNAYRLINGESDGLPGLIVDCYDQFLVCQISSAGIEYWRDTIIPLLQELHPAQGIYERSDLEIRHKEGFAPRSGVINGEEPPSLIEIQEYDCRYLVNVRQGHKTGFYLDQRDSRMRLAEYCEGAEVLNCFSYSAAFAVVALKYGARSVTNIDSSQASLKLGTQNLELNQLNSEQVQNVEGNAFQVLRKYNNEDKKFDLIILDPPKFIESKSQLTRASRGYKDINRLAFKLLRNGGYLLTFSCSGLLDAALFQKIVADAALDAGCFAQIIGRLNQASDHPVALPFPEGHYLKGLICRVTTE